jgi:hypothetical protein
LNLQSSPLLNRVDLLWAAGESPGLIDAQTRASILSEIFDRQRADGGWSTLALMPNWPRRDGSVLLEVSDGYATGFVAWLLQENGIPTSDSDDAATAFSVLALVRAQPGSAANSSPNRAQDLVGVNVSNTTSE